MGFNVKMHVWEWQDVIVMVGMQEQKNVISTHIHILELSMQDSMLKWQTNNNSKMEVTQLSISELINHSMESE